MNRIIYIIIFSTLLTGCEIFTIGSPHQKKKQVVISQESAVGAVFLFKTELDSNNVRAATRLLVEEDGSSFLAIEKYDMYFEIARIGRLISSKPITEVVSDTINPKRHEIQVQFDYSRKFTFRTEKIDSSWYIVGYEDKGFTY